MNSFVQKHRSDVIRVLSGFDRLIFRGTPRGLAYVDGMNRFLSAKRVLLKDFGHFADRTSEAVKQASLAAARRAERRIVYLESPSIRKDELARRIATEDGIDEALICVLTAVEPMRGFDIRKNRERKKLELVKRSRKCLHAYHYHLHPVFGFIHIRLQTWFPFEVQIWINGREWLSRTLDAKKVAYERRDKIRLLRAHGLLAKRPRSHRYMLTQKGQQAVSALIAVYQASADSLCSGAEQSGTGASCGCDHGQQ